MKKIIKISPLVFAAMLTFSACNKKTLEVTNLNQPSYDVLNTESGMYAYAKGFYKIGFGDQTVGSLDDGLGFGMLLIVQAFHEGMGDNIWVPWGNNSFKFADGPKWVKLNNLSQVNNPIGQGQIAELKLRNSRAYGASNSFLPEWTYMYFLNNSSNLLLSKLGSVAFTGDAATKKKVLDAWASWWKGYAYSRIGSMYISGVLADQPNTTNGAFVANTGVITEATKYLDRAIADLNGIAAGPYGEVMSQIMPIYLQTGASGYPTAAEWIKNINTMKARNILVNKTISAMAAADWNAILTLTNNGLQLNDYIFLC